MINPDWVYVIVAVIVAPLVYYLVVHFENDLAWERSLRQEQDEANVQAAAVVREPRRLEPIANPAAGRAHTPSLPQLVHNARPSQRSHRQRSAA